jgi:hypothetical protein
MIVPDEELKVKVDWFESRQDASQLFNPLLHLLFRYFRKKQFLLIKTRVG